MTILQTHLKTAPRLAAKRRVQVNQHFAAIGRFVRGCGLWVIKTTANVINGMGQRYSNTPKARA